MIDFRQHKDLIKEEVKKVNDDDQNWKWRVEKVTKHKVLIRWEYLDYMEEQHPKNCFSLTVDYPEDEDLKNAVTYNRPDGTFIDFVTYGPEHWDDTRTVEKAIKIAIQEVAEYAHNHY